MLTKTRIAVCAAAVLLAGTAGTAQASASMTSSSAAFSAHAAERDRVHEKRRLKLKKKRKLSMRERNKEIAREMAAKRGWNRRQFRCLEQLWARESGWNHHASNGNSGAHGIPQALPGSKMASAGPNWQSNPRTQIRWGLRYIKGRYGTPCGAWGHFQSAGWY